MVLAILAVVLFGVLAVLNERIGRVMVADALKPTARPVAPVGGSVGHPGASWGTYRTYAASSPTVRTYGRKHLDAGALTAPGGPAAIEIEHRTPTRAPDVTADLAVPLGQALATAAIVALCAGILGLLAGRSDAAKLAAGAFVVTLAAAWLWRLGVVTSLLQVVEVITRTDLDGDGVAGKPDPDEGHTMLVDPGKAREKAAKSSRHREQAAQLADMLAFWRQCSTIGTAERAHGVKPGTPGQVAFRAKRDTLMRLGLAKWQNEGNHNLGWQLATDEATALDILREHVRNLT